jgi:PAS domain S-box-containing protein
VVHSIAEDTAGNLWIADQERGLLRLLPGNAVQEIPWAGLGNKDFAGALAADPLQSGLWLGLSNGGVANFNDGGVRASYSAADGLGQGRVNDLRIDPDGTLWAATEGGLSRLKNGHFGTLTSKNGFPCDSVQWSIEDNDHSFWLYMPCGLVRIARSEMDAWAAAVDKDKNTKRRIQATVFDSSDGARTHSLAGGYSPHVAKSMDGRLWFTGPDGVSVVDPRHLPFNTLPPLVHIEQVTADRKTYWQNWTGDASSSPPKLPPLVRDLTIDYTALSLVAPEKVLFRYKLEGWDQDWQDAGTRRQAFYGNLPPRKYTFRVIASNNSGVWNDTGASLDFAIAAAYYQTTWFRALCVLAVLALAYGAYRFRVRQLRREEKKLRDVVETIPAIAWTALPNGWVDFSNHHWEEYTGLSVEEAAGSGWEAAVHPEDVKRHTKKWRAAVASGEPFENEARYRRADGEYRWFLVRAVPLRDGGGKICKWYGTKTDIEDRKHAEQLQADLTHASRVSTMGELVASIAHELAQPITVTTAHAKASLRWLQRDPPNLTEVRKGTERIMEAGTLASEIIDRLRSLYKKSAPKRELVAINEVIGEMVPLLRSEANEYAVSIRTDLAADLPKITADRVQLQQVLMNLILNGIEAMKDTGGVLTMRSQSGEDGQIEISVNDTGPGLPPGQANQIFDAFFTTKPQGSGMGLSISKSIVEAHGGRIWATANEGRGATFHFTLPIATEELKVPAAKT